MRDRTIVLAILEGHFAIKRDRDRVNPRLLEPGPRCEPIELDETSSIDV